MKKVGWFSHFCIWVHLPRLGSDKGHRHSSLDLSCLDSNTAMHTAQPCPAHSKTWREYVSVNHLEYPGIWSNQNSEPWVKRIFFRFWEPWKYPENVLKMSQLFEQCWPSGFWLARKISCFSGLFHCTSPHKLYQNQTYNVRPPSYKLVYKPQWL